MTTYLDASEGRAGAVPPPELSDHHTAELDASEISPEVRAARGYETLYGTAEDRARLHEADIPIWSYREDTAFPGLFLPIYRVTGERISTQFKPGQPQPCDGKLVKYASAKSKTGRLDVPPTVSAGVRVVTTPLWITEGVKKSDSLASKGLAVIGLAGVFNFRSRSGTLGDWEDIPLKGRTVVICFDSDAKYKRNVSSAMRRLGMWLESKGAADIRYLIVPEEVDGTPVKGVDDYFHAGGTLEGLRDAASKEMPSDNTRDAAFSDAVLADTVCFEALEGNYRWAAGLGWMRWDGKVWTEATDATVLEEIRQWSLAGFQRVLDKQRAEPSKDYRSEMDGWRGALAASKLGNLLKLSRGVLESSATDFDADPDVINCRNGILDLRTGVLTPHDPDRLMTKITGCDYVPATFHPDWIRALKAVPAGVVDWFQIRMGQGITGHTPPDDIILICQGGGSNGKALDVDTPMLTANRGWTTMGDLKAGDEVYGPDGQPTAITHAFDVLHGRPCYRVTTADGRSVVADADHLWTVRLSKGTSKLNKPRWVTMTTEQMVQRGIYGRTGGGRAELRFRLPEQQAVQSKPIDLPFDPYVLGAWLGDGESIGSRFTCHPDDVQIVREIEASGVPVRKLSPKYLWALGGGTCRGKRNGQSVAERLRALGVLGNKHIPEQYLTGSQDQRLALLQGLMDTDGYASAGQGQAEFTSTRKCLADGVLYLARSLGWKATIKESVATLNGVAVGPKWRVMWTPGPDGLIPFRLTRKADRIRASRPRVRTSAPSIAAIEPVDSRPVRCITVDREDALYLAGSDLIPTHNSTIMDAIAKAAGKRDGYHTAVADRALLGNASDNHPTEMMDFLGARLAVLEETPETKKLDVTRVKKLAGTDQITARKMRQDSVTFTTTHSLVINTNPKPLVEESDHGTWRRLAMLCFPYTYRKPGEACTGPNDRPGDLNLRQRVKTDERVSEAVLAWLVDGARKWYAADRIMPPVPADVERDTVEWRRESDLVLSFIGDVLEFDWNSHIYAPELREHFNKYLADKGHREWTDRTFKTRFGGHDECARNGVQHKRVRARDGRSTLTPLAKIPDPAWVWLGIKFQDPDENGQVNQGEQNPVPPVPSSPYNPEIGSHIGGTDTHGTGGTGSPNAFEADPFGEDPFAEAEDDHTPVVAIPAPSPAPAQESVPLRAGGSIGFDLEGHSVTRLFRHTDLGGDPYVKLSGYITEDGEEVVVNSPAELIKRLEDADEIYGHNLFGYDLIALARHHGADYDKLAAKTVDTLRWAQTEDPPGAAHEKPWATKGYYGLDALAERKGLPGKTDDLKGLALKHAPGEIDGRKLTEAERLDEGFGRIPADDPEYRAYFSGDLKATRGVRRALGEPSDYMRREMRVAAIQHRPTLTGWRVDVPVLRELAEAEADKRRESLEWLHENCGVPLTKEVTRGRPGKKVTAEEPVKSPLGTRAGKDAIIRALADRGVASYPKTKSKDIALNKDALGAASFLAFDSEGKPVTRPALLNPEALRLFPAADVDALREMCGHIVTVTSSVQKYQEILDHLVGDRIHPQVGDLQGSGRWAYVRPSVTNMAKRGGKVHQRRPLIADDGSLLICFDLDQVDMRAVAGHSQDLAYMALFAPGMDAHSMVTDAVFGRDNCSCTGPKHTCEWRDKAKASGHGWNYGMGVNSLVIRQGVERAVAQQFDDQMNSQFPGLCAWRTEIRERGKAGQMLDNGFGRLMRCNPDRAWTQAPALMGQGGARDIMCEALLRLVDLIPEATEWLRCVVHDEVVLCVPEHMAEGVKDAVLEAFTFEFKGVPITAGASKASVTWSGCYAKD